MARKKKKKVVRLPDPLPPVLTKREVALYLRVTERYVNVLMVKRRLPYSRVGNRRCRFLLTEVNAWLKKNSPQAVAA
jgi:excisionase family DNA binding protein